MFKKMLQFVCVVVLAVVMFMGTTANAEPVMTFKSYGDFSTSRGLYMATGDNFMVQVGGITMSLVDAGFNMGYWHLAFTNSAGNVVGYAVNSLGNPSLRGKLCGDYSGVAAEQDIYGNWYTGLSNGEKPVGVYLVYDKNNNGWDIVGGVLGSVEDLAEGDLFFNETQIIIGGVLGAVSNLPAYLTTGDSYLPTMTVVIPEPATMAVLSLGTLLLRKRK